MLAVQEYPASVTKGVLSIDCFVQDSLGFDRSASIFSFDPNHQGCGEFFTIVEQNNTAYIDDYTNQTVVNGSWGDTYIPNVKKQLIGIPPYFLKALLYLFFPVLVTAMCVVVFCGYCKMKRKHKADPQYEVDRLFLEQSGNIGLRDLAMKHNLPKDSISFAYLSSFDNFVTAVTMTFFLIYPSIVEMTFGLLNCKRIGVCDDDLFLVEDMSVQCWTKTHTA